MLHNLLKIIIIKQLDWHPHALVKGNFQSTSKFCLKCVKKFSQASCMNDSYQFNFKKFKKLKLLITSLSLIDSIFYVTFRSNYDPPQGTNLCYVFLPL